MRARRPRPLSLIVPLTVAASVGGGITAASAQAPPDPARLLADAAANLAKVRSLHIESVDRDRDGTSRIRADVLSSGDGDVRLTQPKLGTLRLRKVSSATFLRGDTAYWKAVGGKGEEATSTARRLAGRWFRVAAADAREFSTLFREFTPKSLAECVSADGVYGTLSPGGTATVGGTKATVLIDAGDRPGTTPGRIFLSDGPTPLPLRAQVTGRVKPGGKATDCSDPKSTSTSSDTRFSKFDRKLTITAPKNAIRLPSVSGDGGDAPTLSR